MTRDTIGSAFSFTSEGDVVIPLNDRIETASLKVALVSVDPGKQCGIATFGNDVLASTNGANPFIDVDLVPIRDGEVEDGALAIGRDRLESYTAAAQTINDAGYDVVWIQHEFGIFGGPDGEHVLEFARRLAAPLFITMHTVLEDPSANQRRIMEELVARASLIMSMSAQGRDILASHYGASHNRLTVIEHGAPDRPYREPLAARLERDLSASRLLATFGLIGQGKGLEHVIDALPAIIARHPGTRYRIIGATHPNLVAHEGEAYRDALKERAERLGVADAIDWVDAFLDREELLDELELCDIYITPYPNLAQATSGTLAYAIAMGKAVISTPYIHARELLADGIGRLVEPEDAPAIAQAVNALLDDEQMLEAVQQRAYVRGRGTVWSEFGKAAGRAIRAVKGAAPAPLPSLDLNVTPVMEMTDDVGMLQHGRFTVADRSHGYALDDSVRALMLAARLAREGKHALAREAGVYAAFTQHAWTGEGFRNFMGYDRRWLEDVGSEDSHGRTIWALGEVIASPPAPHLADWARALYDDALPVIAQMESPRTLAFTMLGCIARLRVDPSHGASRTLLADNGDKLCRALAASRRPSWAWFEELLAYDNTRLSEALIHAGRILGVSEMTECGLETLDWIAGLQIDAKGQFRPIGSDTFGKKRTVYPFDQQPLEALAFIEASLAAHGATGEGKWLERADSAWGWFFGRNDRGVSLIDRETMRCFDGLTPHGRNLNSGAESILAFLLSHVALRAYGRTGQASEGGPIEFTADLRQTGTD